MPNFGAQMALAFCNRLIDFFLIIGYNFIVLCKIADSLLRRLRKLYSVPPKGCFHGYAERKSGMDSDGGSIIIGVLLILLIVIIRCFFTVCETALTEISDGKVKSFEKSKVKAERTVYGMLKKPLRLMTAFSAIRITTAALAAFVTASWFYKPLFMLFYRLADETENVWAVFGLKAASVLLLTLVLVVMLTVFTDGIPRRITAFKGNSEAISLKCSAFMHGVILLLMPLTVVSEKLITGCSSLFGVDSSAERELVTEEEIMMMVDAGNETGVIEETQREMINNVFEFGDLPVSDVMTHRTDITAVATDAKISDLVYLAINSGFSRIPVYKESIDHIIGIICVKDLLCLVGNDSADSLSINDFIRDIIYVPEYSSCGALFKRMTVEKTQLAVAVDEYGGTAGIVSMEDLVESIVGSIQDEYDNETEELIKISDNEYSVSGTAQPEDIMEKLGAPLPEDSGFDTMSGFLISLLGHIPENGEMPSAVYKNVKLTALITEDMRITRIKAEIIPENDEAEINKDEERADDNAEKENT